MRERFNRIGRHTVEAEQVVGNTTRTIRCEDGSTLNVRAEDKHWCLFDPGADLPFTTIPDSLFRENYVAAPPPAPAEPPAAPPPAPTDPAPSSEPVS